MFTDCFALTSPPFQLLPDPRFWFDSTTHKRAFTYLGYGLQQGEGFVVITGDVGAGKTTLVARLLATIDPLRVRAVAVAFTQLDGDDMLRAIADQLGIASNGVPAASLATAIERNCAEAARSGQRTLLIVDEAQNLDHAALETLRMLSNVAVNGQAMVQILLLGQPEFGDRIGSAPEFEQLRQRVIAAHHLGPMTADEVRPYLEHRLRVAGSTGRPAFDDGAVTALFAAAGGIPRKLNRLAGRAVMAAGLDRRDVIDAAAIAQVAAELAAETPAPLPRGAASEYALDQEARIAMLETQLREQEGALRRVLTLLIDWVEGEAQAAPLREVARAPAA